MLLRIWISWTFIHCFNVYIKWKLIQAQKTLNSEFSWISKYSKYSQLISSVSQSCWTLCDPMNRSTPGLPVHHQLPEFTQTHVHQVISWWCHPAISFSVIPFSSCPQSLPHQGLFQWVNSLHEVAKVLEFQLQHQSFQWTPRTDLL